MSLRNSNILKKAPYLKLSEGVYHRNDFLNYLNVPRLVQRSVWGPLKVVVTFRYVATTKSLEYVVR